MESTSRLFGARCVLEGEEEPLFVSHTLKNRISALTKCILHCEEKLAACSGAEQTYRITTDQMLKEAGVESPTISVEELRRLVDGLYQKRTSLRRQRVSISHWQDRPSILPQMVGLRDEDLLYATLFRSINENSILTQEEKKEALDAFSSISHEEEDVQSRITRVAEWIKHRGADFIEKLFGQRDINLPSMVLSLDLNKADVCQQLRFLVALGADIDAADEEGRTLLHILSISDWNQSLLRTVVDLGASIEKRDRLGRSALHLAAESGSLGILRTLCQAGADLYAEDRSGYTPFFYAALQNQMAACCLLCAFGVDVDEGMGPSGRPSLVYALLTRNTPMIERLVSLGASRSMAEDMVQKIKVAHLWSFAGTERMTTALGSRYDWKYERCFVEVSALWEEELVAKANQYGPAVVPAEELSSLQELLHYGSSSLVENQGVYSTKAMVDRIHSGAITVQYTGYATPEEAHTITVVFGRDKAYVINRGAGRDLRFGVTCSTCPKEKVQEEMIEKLRHRFSSPQEMQTFFRQPPFEDVLEDESLPMKPQKVGNCSYANIKPVLFVLLSLLRESSIADPKVRIPRAYEHYKELSERSRFVGVHDALGAIHSPLRLFAPFPLRRIERRPRISPQKKAELKAAIEAHTKEFRCSKVTLFAFDDSPRSFTTYIENKVRRSSLSEARKIEIRKQIRALARVVFSSHDMAVRFVSWLRTQNEDMVLGLLGWSDPNRSSVPTEQLPLFTLKDQPEDCFELELLAAMGADFTIRDQKRDTILHRLSIYSQCSVVIVRLARLGADINALNAHHETPLVVAMKAQNYALVQQLLELGASLAIPDGEGNTPQKIAHSLGDLRLIQLMETQGRVM